MADSQNSVSDDVPPETLDELEFDVDGSDGDSAGGSSSGGGSASGGSGGAGDGSAATAGAIPVYVLTALPDPERAAFPDTEQGDPVSRASDPEPERRDFAAETAQAAVNVARRRLRPVDVVDIQLDPDGMPSLGVPMYQSRRGWMGGVTVATSSEALRRARRDRRDARRAERPGFAREFVAGLSGAPVRDRDPDRPASLVTSDVDLMIRELMAGASNKDVREGRLPEGILERKGARPETLDQALYEFKRGLNAERRARPRPIRAEDDQRSLMDVLRRSRVVVAPADEADELAEDLPDVAVIGYTGADPASLESLQRGVAVAVDAVAAYRDDQERQRAKLAAALRRLWSERMQLIALGGDITDQQRARLAEVEDRIGAIVNLVNVSHAASDELREARESIYLAAEDVEIALRKGNATDPDLGDFEAVTAESERLGERAEGIADRAIDSIDSFDAEAAQWAREQALEPQLPEELDAAVGTLELPVGHSLEVDGVSGTFDITEHRFELNPAEFHPDNDEASPSQAGEQALAGELFGQDPPGGPDFGQPADGNSQSPDPGDRAPSDSASDADRSPDGPDAGAQDQTPVDTTADVPEPTSDAGADPSEAAVSQPGERELVSRQNSRVYADVEAGEHPNGSGAASVVFEHAQDGRLEAADFAAAPPVRRSASTQAYRPGEEDTDDAGGNGSSVGMAAPEIKAEITRRVQESTDTDAPERAATQYRRHRQVSRSAAARLPPAAGNDVRDEEGDSGTDSRSRASEIDPIEVPRRDEDPGKPGVSGARAVDFPAAAPPVKLAPPLDSGPAEVVSDSRFEPTPPGEVRPRLIHPSPELTGAQSRTTAPFNPHGNTIHATVQEVPIHRLPDQDSRALVELIRPYSPAAAPPPPSRSAKSGPAR
ncbi:MAG TPA: hypothetical protein VHU91_06390 [Mycobacteriales bacterium]|jgi:hypothetical protein|nr:hypothetical protein [Mycobacteriales bacterium]